MVGATLGRDDVLFGYKSCARLVPRFAIIEAYVPGIPGRSGVDEVERCGGPGFFGTKIYEILI